MATLSTQDINYTGLAPSYAACTGGGDNFTPDGDTFIPVKTGSGGALPVTIAVKATSVGGQAIGNVVVSVPAAGERMIGPFPANFFGDPTNAGLGAITYSGVTSLTIAVLRSRAPSGA